MALSPAIRTVAIVGTGVIGRSWAAVFARAGCETRLFDVDPDQLPRARVWLDGQRKPDWGPIVACATVDAALDTAGYVQESGPERLDVKQQLFVDLDRAAPPSAILASSTSAFDMTEIARGLRHPERCIVAHPVNPPHVIPAVEVLGGIRTAVDVVDRTCDLLRAVGQTPVVLKKHVHGFILNRLQFALVREAIHLLQHDVADVEAIDAVVREGLGLRWALLGPFAVADTNKDDGVRAYFGGYEQWIIDLMNQLGPTPSLDGDLIERIGKALDGARGETSRAEVREWRDRMVVEIRRLKADNPVARVGERAQ
ncbi:MAG: 3-hydroxyacyl-CoA dehydrogenase [Acidobacteria bacterium]|nr:3-hydroxyacyl-CoA dehydrogenase [Acidobacteriota bacterium]